jgi:hypothetical protein
MGEEVGKTVDIYVFLSAEATQALADNGTTLSELLAKREGLQVQETWGIDPTNSHTSSTRDAATILIATSALVAALTPAITRAIEALTGGRTMVKEMTLEPAPAADPSAAGFSAPKILRWVERPLNTELTIKGPLGIEISSRSN